MMLGREVRLLEYFIYGLVVSNIIFRERYVVELVDRMEEVYDKFRG